MGRYTLGKSVGTTDKGSSRKHTPAPNTLGQVSVDAIPEIKQPRVVPQKWQGNTFISNPSPTLAPNLKLPSLKNVLAEPQRDMGRLAKALEGFNSQLVPFAKSAIELGAKQRDYYANEADRIISQANVEGKTSLQKLTALQSELVEESSQKPYTIKDEQDGLIPEGSKVGEYRPGTTIESIEEATILANKIKSNSRLENAIKSKYKEREVISNAAAIDSLQKTATIPGTKEIVNKDGIKETIDIEIPIHTLKPNDPRYLKWLDKNIWKDVDLNTFEYNNVKGKIIQYRTNAMTSQSSNYSDHLDVLKTQDVRETSRDVGTQLGAGELDIATATASLQGLVEAIHLYGTDKELKDKLNKMIIKGTITAYMKAVEERGTQLDWEQLEQMFESLAIGPQESRVTVVDGKSVINQKQLWLNQFDPGFYDDQVYAAQNQLSRHDKKQNQVNDSLYENNGTAHFNKTIRPTLYKDGEFQYQNIEDALESVESWRLQQIENDPNATLSINKAANTMRAEVSGIFVSDYESDKTNILSAISTAYDTNNYDLVEFLLGEFQNDWGFDPKALSWLNKQKEDISDRKKGSAKQVKELIKPFLGDVKEWYVDRYGGLQKTEGQSDIDEQTNYAEIERTLVNNIIDSLKEKNLPITAENVTKEIDVLKKEWGKDKSLTKDNLTKRLGVINRLLGDTNRVEVNDDPEDNVSFKGNTEQGLKAWEAVYDPTKTGKVTVLNNNQKFKLAQMVNSTTPIFEQSVYGEITDRIFENRNEDPNVITQNFDPRLKILVNNLPSEFRDKPGTFLIHEMKKYGIEFDPTDEALLKSLDTLEISQTDDSNVWSASNLSTSNGVLIASTNLQGLGLGETKVAERKSTAPLSLKEIIKEQNGATDFKGTTNQNYDPSKGDLRSDPSENYFHNFKPELIPHALTRIETLNEKDINAMVVGALLEAGPTDRGKYEVVSSLLMRSVEPVNMVNGKFVRAKPWAIGRVLAQKGQYEAIFNPGERAVRNGYTTVTPYTQKELESSQPNFVKLGKVLNTSPKKAKKLYDLWKGRLIKQLDFKR